MSTFLSYEDRGKYDGLRERIFAGVRITQATRSRWGMLSMRYGLVLLLFMLGILSVSWWFGLDAGEQNTRDWKQLIANAEISREHGDLNRADDLYLQAGRVASWRRDWVGLYAAACGMSKLYEGNSSGVIRGLLVGAMLAAQDQRSEEGLRIVANAFASMGQDSLANMALPRIQAKGRNVPSSAIEGIPQSCDW